jgi:adenylate kinase
MTTDLGQIFVEYSSRGLLVPDDATVKLWRVTVDAMVSAHRYRPASDILVLDGIPRNVEQARFMEPHIEVLKVFHLSCPDRTELARRLRKRALKDNRFDDANETVIQNRFATYEAETKPILDYYAGDRIVDIDASQPPAKVLYDILAGVMTLDAWKEQEKMKI